MERSFRHVWRSFVCWLHGHEMGVYANKDRVLINLCTRCGVVHKFGELKKMPLKLIEEMDDESDHI